MKVSCIMLVYLFSDENDRKLASAHDFVMAGLSQNTGKVSH